MPTIHQKKLFKNHYKIKEKMATNDKWIMKNKKFEEIGYLWMLAFADQIKSDTALKNVFKNLNSHLSCSCKISV